MKCYVEPYPKLRVDMAWTGTNFCCAWHDDAAGTVICTAETLEKLMKDFEESLKLHIDGCVADGDVLPQYLVDGKYEIEYFLKVDGDEHFRKL